MAKLAEDPSFGSLRDIQEALADLQRRLADVEMNLGSIKGDLQGNLGLVNSLMDSTEVGDHSIKRINQIVRRMSEANSQEGILEIYLEEALPSANRAILFLQNQGTYRPWKAFGMAAHQIDNLSIESREDPIFRAAEQKELFFRKGNPAESFSWLSSGERQAVNIICLPLVFGNEAPVVFYADSNQDIPVDSLELLTHISVLVLKNVHLRQLVSTTFGAQPIETRSEEPLSASESAASKFSVVTPSAGLATEVDQTSVEPSAPEPAEYRSEPTEEEIREESPVDSSTKFEPSSVPIESASITEAADVSERSATEESFAIDTEEPTSATVADTADQASPEVEEFQLDASPVQDDSLVDQRSPREEISTGEGAAVEEVSEPQTEEVAETTTEESVAEPEIESTQPVYSSAETVPPEVEEVQYASEEEERNHHEARRFARLLVSEIKLYNEQQVELGKEGKDLYARLRQDIDRSREMYDKRVHPDVAERTDHFHSELVRILAADDHSLLGDDYPGPNSV